MLNALKVRTVPNSHTRVGAVALQVATAGVMLTGAAPANADAVAYLVNVTMRPGYNFPNADTPLAYGHRICDKVDHARHSATNHR